MKPIPRAATGLASPANLFLAAFLLFWMALLSQAGFAASPLCASAGDSQNFEWVTRVSINGVSVGIPRAGYHDATASTIANLQAGQTYAVEVDVATDGTIYQEFVKFWFDLDQNGSIHDGALNDYAGSGSELVYDTDASFSTFRTYTGNITIPGAAFNGPMFVRMIMQFAAAPALCGTYDYGTTVDLQVAIAGGAINPSAPVAPSSPVAVAGNASATVSFTASPSAVIGYQVVSTPGGVVATGAASPITVNGLTNGVTYTFEVYAKASATVFSDPSSPSNAVTPSAGPPPVTAQSISFGALANRTYGEAPFAVSATGGASGNPVTFASLTAGTCSVSGSTVTIVAVGGCTVRASQAGNASYSAAADVDQSFSIGQASQSIAFDALPGRTFGDAPFAVSATGGASGNPVTFASLTAGTCSVSASTVTIVAAGPCTIRASQAGNAVFQAAPDIDQSFTIAKASQAIAFGFLSGRTFGDAPFAVSATGGASGNVVTFLSQTPGTCSVAGNTVTIVSGGPCTVRASQAGDANYLAAADVIQTFFIDKAAQAISFVMPGGHTFGDAPFAISANGGASGNPVTFASLTPGACSMAGNNVTIISPGPCTIRASQAGDANYLAAPDVDRSLSIGRIAQSIAFGPAPLLAAGGTAPVAATGGASGQPVRLTSVTTAICSITGGLVRAATAGRCVIAADQDGNATYDAAPQATLAIEAFVPPPNLSALWWDPAEPGWGLNVNQQDGIVFATLFTYARDGEPLWLVASRAERQDDGAFRGALYRTSGPRFDQAPWPAFSIVPAGELVLRLTGNDRAVVSYTYFDGVGSQAVTKTVSRMAFQSRMPACVSTTGTRASETNAQDIWWNDAEPGWGLNIAHQGDMFFATLFTYDENGRDLWLVASALARTADGSYEGDLLRTRVVPGFDPARPWSGYTASVVGTMHVQFSDGETGRVVYTLNGRTVDKHVTRMVYGQTVPACRY